MGGAEKATSGTVQDRPWVRRIMQWLEQIMGEVSAVLVVRVEQAVGNTNLKSLEKKTVVMYS